MNWNEFLADFLLFSVMYWSGYYMGRRWERRQFPFIRS